VGAARPNGPMAPLRCIDMTSVTSPQQTGRSGADIPGPRGGHGVRLLVLGSDSDAQKLRDQAVAAGYELAQRYSARVSHVAYGSGIDPEDARYSRIRDAGLPIVPIQACASELGLGAGTAGTGAAGVAGGGAHAAASAATDTDHGAAGAKTGEKAKSDERAELGRVELARGAEDHAAVEGDAEVEVWNETARGESFGVATKLDEFEAEVLEFPPFERLAGDSATGLVPGFDADFGIESGEREAAADLHSAAALADDLADVPHAAAATDTADEDADEDDDDEDADEPPLGGQVIGADPWLGEAIDADVTGYLPQITEATVAPDVIEADALASTAADTARSPEGRRPTRRFLVSLAWGLVPFVSFGLLTPVAFGYAAYRLRSRTLALAALGYTLAVVLSFALSAVRSSAATPGDASGTLLTFALAVTWIGGTVHALSLRAKVFAA